jgi:hypothetical protein
MNPIPGAALAGAAGATVLALLGLAPAAASVAGTITVTISATRLKHWGIPGADAAFVPDADQSAYAVHIRTASRPRALCDALHAAAGRDHTIASASIDGDANLDHRSGDEEQMSFLLTVANDAVAGRGILYICSRPVFAMMSKGAYPTESFYQSSAEHRLSANRRLSLHPGENDPVHLTASVDASQW